MLPVLLPMIAPMVIKGIGNAIASKSKKISKDYDEKADRIGMADDNLRELLDDLFDWVEDKVAASTNKIDDIAILPLIAIARKVYDIDDDIGGDEN